MTKVIVTILVLVAMSGSNCPNDSATTQNNPQCQLIPGGTCTNTVLTGTSLVGKDLSGMVFNGVNLSGVDATGAVLLGATIIVNSPEDLKGFMLLNAQIDGMVVTVANLTDSQLSAIQAEWVSAAKSCVDVKVNGKLLGSCAKYKDETDPVSIDSCFTSFKTTASQLAVTDLEERYNQLRAAKTSEELTKIAVCYDTLKFAQDKLIAEAQVALPFPIIETPPASGECDIPEQTCSGLNAGGNDVELIGEDLSGLQLYNVGAVDLDLRDANVSNGVLTGNLTDADFSGANLTNATLIGNLTGVDLSNALLSNSIFADEQAARLANSIFKDAVVDDARFFLGKGDKAASSNDMLAFANKLMVEAVSCENLTIVGANTLRWTNTNICQEYRRHLLLDASEVVKCKQALGLLNDALDNIDDALEKITPSAPPEQLSCLVRLRAVTNATELPFNMSSDVRISHQNLSLLDASGLALPNTTFNDSNLARTTFVGTDLSNSVIVTTKPEYTEGTDFTFAILDRAAFTGPVVIGPAIQAQTLATAWSSINTTFNGAPVGSAAQFQELMVPNTALQPYCAEKALAIDSAVSVPNASDAVLALSATCESLEDLTDDLIVVPKEPEPRAQGVYPVQFSCVFGIDAHLPADCSGSEVERLDFANQNYADEEFPGAQANRADFSGAVFTNAQLPNAHLLNSDFTRTRFFNTKLAGAELSGRFDNSDFRSANLTQATITDKGQYAYPDIYNWSNPIKNWYITKADFLGADLTGAQIAGPKWVDNTMMMNLAAKIKSSAKACEGLTITNTVNTISFEKDECMQHRQEQAKKLTDCLEMFDMSPAPPRSAGELATKRKDLLANAAVFGNYQAQRRRDINECYGLVVAAQKSLIDFDTFCEKQTTQASCTNNSVRPCVWNGQSCATPACQANVSQMAEYCAGLTDCSESTFGTGDNIGWKMCRQEGDLCLVNDTINAEYKTGVICAKNNFSGTCNLKTSLVPFVGYNLCKWSPPQ